MEDLSKLAQVPAKLNFEALQKQNLELKSGNTILVTTVLLIGVSVIVFIIIQRMNEEKEKDKL
ncbi:hypothetical protein [Flavobacterium koreense]